MNSLTILTTPPFNLSKEKADSLIKTIEDMTVAEKVGQLFFLLHSEMLTKQDSFQQLKTYKPGGLMFRPTTQSVIDEVIDFAATNLPIQPFFSANIESGINALLAHETGYGSAMLLSATNHDHLVKKAVTDMAQTASHVGVNMTFSPVTDLQLNPDNPITGTRSFGDQVAHVIQHSQSFINSFLEQQILPVIKHFPGDGVDNRDQHLLPSINSLSFENWLETYGKVYQTLIDNGAPCIMAGHILLPEYERKVCPDIADNDLKPATLSPLLLKKLLRTELGFNGLIITDASNMGGFNSFYPRKKAIVASIKAGCDMLLFTADLAEDYQAIHQAVIDEVITPERLTEAITRILGTKALLKSLDKKGLPSLSETPEDLKQAVADEGITLVKNEISFDKLDIKKHQHILLLDRHNGNSVGDQVMPILEAEGFKVTKPEVSDTAFALDAIIGNRQKFKETYDLILYTMNFQGKSNQVTNRLDFGMPMAQFVPLFTKEIPTIMISFGNPYHLVDAPRVPVYINTYSDQPQVVTATIDKLLGKSPFRGKSPVDAFCGWFDTRCY